MLKRWAVLMLVLPLACQDDIVMTSPDLAVELYYGIRCCPGNVPNLGRAQEPKAVRDSSCCASAMAVNGPARPESLTAADSAR